MEISIPARFGWGLSRDRGEGGGDLQPITNYRIKYVWTPIIYISKTSQTLSQDFGRIRNANIRVDLLNIAL